jgi:uncharacterized repeat protein (TIGR01451 family)
MKKLLTFIFYFSVTCLLSFVPMTSVSADSYGTYGGGSTPTDLLINKLVKNPISNVFVENLGSTDPTFSPGSNATFRLVIKNGSGETMNPVTVVDQLPSYLTFVSATVPVTYDKGLNKVIITLNDIIAGDTRTIDLVVAVAPKASFPKGQSHFCVTNYSKVTAPARPNGDDDTAELCMTTAVGKEILPVAGVNDMVALIPFLSLGGIGAVLLKKKK